MLIFKSTLFVAFILLIFSGFNTTSAETGPTPELPEDYSEYEQELLYLEKLQEKDEEQEALAQQTVTDTVSEKAAAPEKNDTLEVEAELKSEPQMPVSPTTNPGSPRRIRSR